MILILISLVGCSSAKEIFEETNSITRNKSIKFSNITIHYEQVNDSDLLDSIVLSIKDAESENNKYLDRTDTNLNVFLLEEDKFLEEFGEYGFSHGLFFSEGNKIYIRVIENDDNLSYFKTIEQSIQNTVAHEYTHFRISEEIKSKDINIDSLPIWYIEGFL